METISFTKLTADGPYRQPTQEQYRQPTYKQELSNFNEETLKKIEEFRAARNEWIATNSKQITDKSKSEGLYKLDEYKGRFALLRRIRFKTTMVQFHHKTLRPLKLYTCKKKLSDTEIEKLINESVKRKIYSKKVEKLASKKSGKKRQSKKKSKDEKAKKSFKNLKASKLEGRLIDSCKCEGKKGLTVVIKGVCLCDKTTLNNLTLGEVCSGYSQLEHKKTKSVAPFHHPAKLTHVADSLEIYRKKSQFRLEEIKEEKEDEVTPQKSLPKKQVRFKLQNKNTENDKLHTQQLAEKNTENDKLHTQQLAEKNTEKDKLHTEQFAEKNTEKDKLHTEQFAKKNTEKDKLHTEQFAKKNTEKDKLHTEQFAKKNTEKDKLHTEQFAKKNTENDKLHTQQLAEKSTENDKLHTQQLAEKNTENDKLHTEQFAKKNTKFTNSPPTEKSFIKKESKQNTAKEKKNSSTDNNIKLKSHSQKTVIPEPKKVTRENLKASSTESKIEAGDNESAVTLYKNIEQEQSRLNLTKEQEEKMKMILKQNDKKNEK